MATLNNIIFYFERWGVLDFLLPFALVFVVSFAILRKSKIFDSLKKKDTFYMIISMALGLLFVVPHVLGRYPPGYDPVAVLNASLPSISLLAVGIVMVLFLLGIFGKELGASFIPYVAVLAMIFVIYIFGSSLGWVVGPWDLFSWWTTEITEMLVILAVFGIVIWFVVREDKPSKIGENIHKGVKAVVQPIGSGSSGGGDPEE